ncbi:MAG TPA: hypothetical protein DEA73_05065 [Peptococcaceae bacterium]|nr:hypothetical protein [Peptococcaceae bacterium]
MLRLKQDARPYMPFKHGNRRETRSVRRTGGRVFLFGLRKDGPENVCRKLKFQEEIGGGALPRKL